MLGDLYKRKKYVVNPENKNQSLLWFFERANGQYRETLNKQTPSQQKKFKEQNPSHLKFVKSDVAKYINLWELEPNFVSQGSQKNFIHFTKKINVLVSKNKLPGENLYKKLIANAILFKTTDKLFGRKGVDAIGDTNLKSFTVAYTVSYFHYLTDNRLDLWKIYEEQKIDDALKNHFKKLLVFVYEHLVKETNNSLISEYAKRESSWSKLKETPYDDNLKDIVSNYLISIIEKENRENEKEIDANSEEDRLFIISEIHKLGMKFWDGFYIYLGSNSLDGFNRNSVEEVFNAIQKNKNLLPRDITIGKKVIQYLAESPSFLEETKTLSKFDDKESVELKFMFDRLKLLSKEDWKKIIDLANQTNIFTIPELGNVKSIQSTIVKNEQIKEQSLIKAFESLQKLKRFGIKV